jgi:hypothetical protein
MAQILEKKYGSADGWFQIDIDSTSQSTPHTAKPLARVYINKIAYDQLSAAAKTDIGNVTLLNALQTVFS